MKKVKKSKCVPPKIKIFAILDRNSVFQHSQIMKIPLINWSRRRNTPRAPRMLPDGSLWTPRLFRGVFNIFCKNIFFLAKISLDFHSNMMENNQKYAKNWSKWKMIKNYPIYHFSMFQVVVASLPRGFSVFWSVCGRSAAFTSAWVRNPRSEHRKVETWKYENNEKWQNTDNYSIIRLSTGCNLLWIWQLN